MDGRLEIGNDPIRSLVPSQAVVTFSCATVAGASRHVTLDLDAKFGLLGHEIGRSI